MKSYKQYTLQCLNFGSKLLQAFLIFLLVSLAISYMYIITWHDTSKPQDKRISQDNIWLRQ